MNNTFSAPDNTAPNSNYFAQQKRIGLSLRLTEDPLITISETQSPLVDINGQAPINNIWWALLLAEIQLMLPLEAAGNGAILIECGEGLIANIKGTDNQEIYLKSPQFLIEPGRINITDTASNGLGKSHDFSLWQEDEKFITDANIRFLKDVPFIFNTLTEGDEMLSSFVGFTINADRPVNIKGEAVALRTEKGSLTFIANETQTTISLEDYELLIDKNAGPNELLPKPEKMALAMSNALLTTTLPASVSLQATVSRRFYLTYPRHGGDIFWPVCLPAYAARSICCQSRDNKTATGKIRGCGRVGSQQSCRNGSVDVGYCKGEVVNCK